ncbi:MAG: Ig-like domain-containing protein [Candidatus Kapaibacteriota bacterium]
MIVENANKLLIIQFLISTAFLLFSCANVKPPSGGPPDRTPPKVVEFFPANYARNFSGKEIYIKFNKWVERNSVVNNIFLNPAEKYEIKWSGKKMYILFPNNLPTNTTFNLLLGTNFTDIDGNKPEQPFNLVFSTGDKIDSGRIVGKVPQSKEQNIFIYSIPTKELNDTMFDINKTFHYRTQPDVNGNFSFEALRYDSYIVVAFIDKNNNKEFDFGSESFGVASDSVYASIQVSDTISLLFAPPIDKTSPVITNAFALNQHTIKIIFSEPIRTIPIRSMPFIVSDTSTLYEFQPNSYFIDKNNPKEIKLFFKDTIPESILSLKILNPEIFTDTAGNQLLFEKSLLLRGSKLKDELSPQIIQNQIFLNTVNDTIEICFSKPIDTTKTKLAIRSINTEQNDTTRAKYDFSSTHTIHIDIPNIKWRSLYNLVIQSDTIYDYLGKIYTNFSASLQVKVGEEPRLGSLKGKLIARLDTNFGEPIVMAIGSEMIFYSKVSSNDFTFDNIPEGEYTLVAFYDKNRNGKYDFGSLRPFAFSEKIIKISKRISIRKGWTIEEMRF